MLVKSDPLLMHHLAPMQHDRQSLAYVLFSYPCLQRPDASLWYGRHRRSSRSSSYSRPPLCGELIGITAPLSAAFASR